jgi:tRNA(Ile)-lysidine synthase
MRIFTGTGIYGLKGIDSKRDNIIRPILNLKIPEILNYLKENKISWREDESNKDNKYRRNYIRNKIIPSINKKFNSAEKSINILSKLAIENDELIDLLLKEKFEIIYKKIKNDIVIDNQKIIGKFILLKHILSKIIRSEFKFDVSNSMFNEISKNLHNEKSNITLYENEKFTINRKYNIKQKKSEIKISKTEKIKNQKMEGWEYPIFLSKDNNVYIKEIDLNIKIQLPDLEFFYKNKDNSNILFLGIGKHKDKVLIRNRKNGDLIKLENGKTKIKKYFIENKLDNKVKNCVPLIIIESEIAAILTNFVSDAKNRVSIDFKISKNQEKIIALSLNNN